MLPLGCFFAFELVFLDQNGSGTVPDGFGTVPEYNIVLSRLGRVPVQIGFARGKVSQDCFFPGKTRSGSRRGKGTSARRSGKEH